MKLKILLTYVESGFGHISSMDGIYDVLCEKYGDIYDIQRSNILTDDGFPNLMRMNGFLIKQVQNTNKIPYFGRVIFPFISFLGGHKLLRFFHRQMANKSFRQGLYALRKRNPDVIVTNHYFTNLLAVEYKRRVDPDVVIINYNPDPTLHSFWDNRDGIFIVNNPFAYKKALKYKFKEDNLVQVTPCVRKSVENNKLSREQLREAYDLPKDKFTVAIADGGYMLGRGPKFAKKLIKSGLPITICIIAGENEKRYKQFKDIEDGKSGLKVAPGMTLKTYPFMQKAYELYGAADVFLTKGGPNAALDSIYMHTPVMINYCPHVIEEGTVKVFVDGRGCGETVYTPKKAIRRIREFMADKTLLGTYTDKIDALIAEGNGADAVADIVAEHAKVRALAVEAQNRSEDSNAADKTQSLGGMADIIGADITANDADGDIVSREDNTVAR